MCHICTYVKNLLETSLIVQIISRNIEYRVKFPHVIIACVFKILRRNKCYTRSIYICRPIDAKKFDNVVRETARYETITYRDEEGKGLSEEEVSPRFGTGRITYGSRNYR